MVERTVYRIELGAPEVRCVVSEGWRDTEIIAVSERS